HILDNLVNMEDVTALVRRLRVSPRWVVRQLSVDARGRARAAWAHTQGDPIHWFDIPAILARQNELVSGDRNIEYVDFIAKRYIAPHNDLRAVSLGCGTGEKELRWANTGLFSHILGVDFAESRVAAASVLAERAGLSGTVRFEVGDVF